MKNRFLSICIAGTLGLVSCQKDTQQDPEISTLSLKVREQASELIKRINKMGEVSISTDGSGDWEITFKESKGQYRGMRVENGPKDGRQEIAEDTDGDGKVDVCGFANEGDLTSLIPNKKYQTLLLDGLKKVKLIKGK